MSRMTGKDALLRPEVQGFLGVLVDDAIADRVGDVELAAEDRQRIRREEEAGRVREIRESCVAAVGGRGGQSTSSTGSSRLRLDE